MSGESATGNLARSGQGYLSPLRCYAARGLSTSPLAMHCVNLALAVAGVFVFVRWAPLGRAHRARFVLGYFPFYEVAVLRRHYAAGALLPWLACAAISSCRSKPGWFGYGGAGGGADPRCGQWSQRLQAGRVASASNTP